MTALPPTSGASEFPNDNPALHRGARWVCLGLRGPARAVSRPLAASEVRASEVRASEPLAPPAVAVDAAAHVASPAAAVDALLVRERRVEAALPVTESRVEAPPERVYAGPLTLDLGRIVLPHRVENVPPPPDFIFRPFVSSRPRLAAVPSVAAAPGVAAPPGAQPIDPRPCRVVDEREAARRIDRGFCVDVAPCIHVGETAGETSRRPLRRRGPSVARALSASPIVPPLPELEAVSA